MKAIRSVWGIHLSMSKTLNASRSVRIGKRTLKKPPGQLKTIPAIPSPPTLFIFRIQSSLKKTPNKQTTTNPKKPLPNTREIKKMLF